MPGSFLISGKAAGGGPQGVATSHRGRGGAPKGGTRRGMGGHQGTPTTLLGPRVEVGRTPMPGAPPGLGCLVPLLDPQHLGTLPDPQPLGLLLDPWSDLDSLVPPGPPTLGSSPGPLEGPRRLGLPWTPNTWILSWTLGRTWTPWSPLDPQHLGPLLDPWKDPDTWVPPGPLVRPGLPGPPWNRISGSLLGPSWVPPRSLTLGSSPGPVVGPRHLSSPWTHNSWVLSQVLDP